ncbi:MAG: nucleotidyltransferase [Flavobacteriales bacterium]
MFSQEVIDAIESFNRHKVKYVVVGGIAVIAHGYDRSTGDMDIWLSNEEDNLDRFKNALAECDFDHDQINEAIDGFKEMGHLTVTIDHRFPFDFMPVYSSKIPFEEAFEKSKQATMFGVNLTVVDLDSLIDMKIKAGRIKDYRDVLELKKKNNLD